MGAWYKAEAGEDIGSDSQTIFAYIRLLSLVLRLLHRFYAGPSLLRAETEDLAVAWTLGMEGY